MFRKKRKNFKAISAVLGQSKLKFSPLAIHSGQHFFRDLGPPTTLVLLRPCKHKGILPFNLIKLANRVNDLKMISILQNEMMLLMLFRKCVVKQRDEIPIYNKIINKPFLRTVCSNIFCENCLFKNILMHLPLKQQENSFSLTHLLDNLLLHETQKYLKLLPLLIRRDLGTSRPIFRDKKFQLPYLLRKYRRKTQQNTQEIW